MKKGYETKAKGQPVCGLFGVPVGQYKDISTTKRFGPSITAVRDSNNRVTRLFGKPATADHNHELFDIIAGDLISSGRFIYLAKDVQDAAGAITAGLVKQGYKVFPNPSTTPGAVERVITTEDGYALLQAGMAEGAFIGPVEASCSIDVPYECSFIESAGVALLYFRGATERGPVVPKANGEFVVSQSDGFYADNGDLTDKTLEIARSLRGRNRAPAGILPYLRDNPPIGLADFHAAPAPRIDIRPDGTVMDIPLDGRNLGAVIDAILDRSSTEVSIEEPIAIAS
jgi:hypothetical protein